MSIILDKGSDTKGIPQEGILWFLEELTSHTGRLLPGSASKSMILVYWLLAEGNKIVL